jgi:hypothetical protein
LGGNEIDLVMSIAAVSGLMVLKRIATERRGW